LGIDCKKKKLSKSQGLAGERVTEASNNLPDGGGFGPHICHYIPAGVFVNKRERTGAGGVYSKEEVKKA